MNKFVYIIIRLKQSKEQNEMFMYAELNILDLNFCRKSSGLKK